MLAGRVETHGTGTASLGAPLWGLATGRRLLEAARLLRRIDQSVVGLAGASVEPAAPAVSRR